MRNVKKKPKTNKGRLKKPKQTQPRDPTQDNNDGPGKEETQIHFPASLLQELPFSALQFIFVCFCLQENKENENKEIR